ncbi:endonuclease domain-containing protein [Brevundimonas sp. NPDC090276]|uniref:endonuclease domain-containing protein n=1 Tax=Brevundimonas sp. NPDC090276 TaxID=3363956 RepID=UPI00383BE698
MEKPSDRNRAFARRSRIAMTDTETEVWRLLRDRRLHGVKFRRQVPIGPYVVDFVCHVLKLVIEADGGVHRLREEADANRDAWLAEAGYTVLRFDNSMILRNPNLVFEGIREHIQRRG